MALDTLFVRFIGMMCHGWSGIVGGIDRKRDKILIERDKVLIERDKILIMRDK